MNTIFDPEEIALKKFVVRWRGYDTREVETFLRAVAVDFRRLIGHVAPAEQPDATGPALAEVRKDLNRLSSQLDQALAALESVTLTEPDHQSRPAASSELADITGMDLNAELRLLSGGSARG